MKLRNLSLLGALLASVAFRPALAADFKWANDGDVGAMDPYTRQETVQLSFLSNIYEPLVRWNRDLKLEPALAASWEQTSPTVWRFHLRPNVKWQDGSPFTADDVVFSLQRILAKTSVMRAPMGAVKEARKVDDLTVDFETTQPDPIFLQEQTNFFIMSKAWCEAHNATEPVLIDASKDENFAVRNAMGTGPFKLDAARARPPHHRREEPGLVGQAAGQCRPRRARRHRQRLHPRRGAALGRRRHDLLRAAAGHGPHLAHRGPQAPADAGAADDLPRHGRGPATSC